MYQENTRRGKTQMVIKGKGHPELDSGSHLELLKMMRFQIKFGMMPLFYNRGFTLIELLVVVLIISILAAVALPQYQKAVMKSRAAEIVLFVKDAQKAMQLYFMQNGYPEECLVLYNSSTNNLDKLDITLPVESLTEKGYSVSMGLCNPSADDDSAVIINKGGVFFSTVAFDSTLQINKRPGGGTSCGGSNSSGVVMCKALTEQLGGICIDAQTDDVCK